MRARPLGVAWALALAVAGCAQPSRDRAWVADAIEARTGHRIASAGGETPGRALPDDVSLEDGVDEDEAVAIALHASPAFLADMARLTSATADFEEAARIDNPRLGAQGPIGVIAAATSLLAPIMSLFQLPQRTEAAGRALESVAESLVQSGLDLARDARLAHIDQVLAEERLRILEALQENAEGLSAIAAARADAGDSSPAEALAVRADAFVAADAVAVATRDRVTAAARLAVLLGREASDPLEVVARRSLPGAAPPVADLLRVARDGRPDVRAAALELEAAGARAGWERSRIVSLSIQADAQWTSTAGGVRLGGTIDLPIFNQNQGGVGRAEAAIERARHRLDAVRQQVTLEVVSARARLEQSLVSRARYADDVLPPLEGALVAATERFELGDDSYLVVLDASARVGAARLRLAELDAEVRRAHAELERAVGARLSIRTEVEP
ncbi:MAG: TolC family protein [Sandaracinaceae bacterium]